ncbi:MAG: peptidase, partial [Anaerolineae bacterium]|nr:peptidase [Anaerolineae bacterium]
MLIIDGHLDLAWNALQWNRNLLLDAGILRVLENRLPGPGRAQNTVTFPDMIRGKVAVCCATLLARCTGVAVPDIDFAIPEQAFGIAQGQLAFYRAMEQRGVLRILTSGADLDAHIAAWEAWDAAQDSTGTAPPLGCIISMESADPIPDPGDLP